MGLFWGPPGGFFSECSDRVPLTVSWALNAAGSCADQGSSAPAPEACGPFAPGLLFKPPPPQQLPFWDCLGLRARRAAAGEQFETPKEGGLQGPLHHPCNYLLLFHCLK